MKWFSLAAGVLLLAVGFVAFDAPPPPYGLAIVTLGTLLLFDWSWQQSADLAALGEEVTRDFYRIDNAKWRYLLAIVVAGANGAATAMGEFGKAQAVVLVGGFALCCLYGFVDLLRSRKRVSDTLSDR